MLETILTYPMCVLFSQYMIMPHQQTESVSVVHEFEPMSKAIDKIQFVVKESPEREGALMH